jgi:hypothetical protein
VTLLACGRERRTCAGARALLPRLPIRPACHTPPMPRMRHACLVERGRRRAGSERKRTLAAKRHKSRKKEKRNAPSFLRILCLFAAISSGLALPVRDQSRAIRSRVRGAGRYNLRRWSAAWPLLRQWFRCCCSSSLADCGYGVTGSARLRNWKAAPEMEPDTTTSTGWSARRMHACPVGPRRRPTDFRRKRTLAAKRHTMRNKRRRIALLFFAALVPLCGYPL